MLYDWKKFLQPWEKPATQESLPLVETLSNVENIINNNNIFFLSKENLKMFLIKIDSLPIEETNFRPK